MCFGPLKNQIWVRISMEILTKLIIHFHSYIMWGLPALTVIFIALWQYEKKQNSWRKAEL
jgi:hypothetical protein